jgi:PAS domain S-box-containing protein
MPSFVTKSAHPGASYGRPNGKKNWQSEQLNEALTDEERFRLLVNAVTDYATFMLDGAGNVASWNAGAQRFKGYTASEIIGRHFSTFYTEEDIQRGVPATALETSARTGKFEAEGWRVRKDGSRF